MIEIKDKTGKILWIGPLNDLYGLDLENLDLSDAFIQFPLDVSRVKTLNIPKIKDIDAVILDACTAYGCHLHMGTWHVCRTTHCRAGWAIYLAREDGKKLEYALGSRNAGALIYAASRPGKKIPNFFAKNEEAMADLIACAKEGQNE